MDLFSLKTLTWAGWQILVQMAIFLATLAVLKRFVFQPLIDLEGRRQAATHGKQQEAEALEQRAQLLSERYHTSIREGRDEATRKLSAALREADTIRHDLVDKARAEAQHVIGKERERLASLETQVFNAVTTEVEQLSRDWVALVQN